MNLKILSVLCAVLLVAVFGAFATFGLPEDVGQDEVSYEILGTSTLNFTGITDTMMELFIGILPLIVYMSIIGGLLVSLPKIFNFKF